LSTDAEKVDKSFVLLNQLFRLLMRVLSIYNSLFSVQELTAAIEKSSDSAVDPDDIPVHFQMLKPLPQSVLVTLLHIINKLWSSESFPSAWQQVVVLPIPKIDKDKSDPSSYHAIALTSCLCKVVEWMINGRLVWCLQIISWLPTCRVASVNKEAQLIILCGSKLLYGKHLYRNSTQYHLFWSGKSTESWKISDSGLRGRLPMFIQGFLQNRQFQAWLSFHLSNVSEQEMGVP